MQATQSKASRKLIAKWSDEIQVGIWERCDWSIRLYEDRTIVSMPYVKWVNNSGSLSYRQSRITGAAHARLIALAQQQIDDDADYSAEACEIANW